MHSKTFLVFMAFTSIVCNNDTVAVTGAKSNELLFVNSKLNINPYQSIAAIPLPGGFKRLDTVNNSFAAWLLQLKLKKDKTVYLYNGTPKINQAAQFAVVDISTGNKNLQQCADAVMRLRAEYLFAAQKFGDIIFYDNDGKAYRFTAPFTKDHLHQYLQTVFVMCGTASLSNQLHRIDISDMRAGDVLIRGGFPGHAVIVVDVAANEKGDKIFMLAQSYMPAQDIHVLVNVDDRNSPWYHLPQGKQIETPEYIFNVGELKRW